jgi:hypothetical protein
VLHGFKGQMKSIKVAGTIIKSLEGADQKTNQYLFESDNKALTITY